MNSDHAFSPHATASPPVFKPMSSPITEVRVREVVDAWAPPGCSLRIALDLHARSTEGHLLYAWATHLGLVAALIGGKLHDGRLFPGAGVSGSLWVILVGASARSRKTTSLQIQQELAQKSDPIRFLDRPGSHEALLTDLHDDADRCLYLPELGDYFAQARRGRLATTNELLVKLFDGKDERITYIKGHLTLKSPRISLLGGVTPAFLLAHTTPQDWRGGFFSRALIFATTPERELRLPTRDVVISGQLQLAFDHYHRLFHTKGVRTPAPVGLTPEAELLWLDWHDEIRNRLDTWTHHEALASILGRASLQTAKLALLHQAILTPENVHSKGGWWITEQAVSLAIALCDLHLRSAVACAVRTYDSIDARDKANLHQILSAASGPLKVGELCRMSDMLMDRVYKILGTLEAQGDAVLHRDGRWQAARPLPASGAKGVLDLL